ncbi:ubiquitin-protein ligase [Moniliophthora roreri]|nr:ubiquitin-protein ligase [Moniliophthora roreri]
MGIEMRSIVQGALYRRKYSLEHHAVFVCIGDGSLLWIQDYSYFGSDAVASVGDSTRNYSDSHAQSLLHAGNLSYAAAQGLLHGGVSSVKFSTSHDNVGRSHASKMFIVLLGLILRELRRSVIMVYGVTGQQVSTKRIPASRY